jgi:hypothetical protein
MSAVDYPSFVPQSIQYFNQNVTLDTTKPIKVRFRAGGSDTTEEEVFENEAVKIDLTDKFTETIVPGSVNFTLGGRTYFDRQGSLYYGLDPVNGAATLGGTINYQTGEVSLSSWANGQAPTITLRSLLTSLEAQPTSTVTFRVPIAPLRPSSFQLLATKVSGGSINVTSDADGNISGSGVSGEINYETGVVILQFGTLVAAAGNESEEWYDAQDVDEDDMIWRPEPIFAETLRYNAVAFTYLPLDADILGLDPVRLPQDGRVPIFRVGGFVVIGHDAETAADTVANTDTIDCGRERLSRVRVIGNDGNTISTGYTVDLDAGIVTFTDVSGYSQPVKVQHRIEDMLQVSDVQISGDLAFTRAVTHEYPEGAYVSSALVTNDLKARVSLIFDQSTWNGTTWADTSTGAATGTFDDITHPITVTNDGALTERWAIQFTSTTAFNIIGEHRGVIGTGNINTSTAPVNPATGAPYFTIPSAGWGSGWATGNILRFNTVGACLPVWLVRTVRQGAESEDEHSFTLIVRGDVDAP